MLAKSVPVLPDIVAFDDIKEEFGQTNELIMVEDEDELEEASEVLEAYDNDEKINEIK